MALIKQGGLNPNEGMVNTTMGLRTPRSPLCELCRERKPGLYTINANGQTVCGSCAGRYGEGVLDGGPEAVVPEPSIANEAVSDGDLDPA